MLFVLGIYFNIHFINKVQVSDHFLNIMSKYGFLSLVNEGTWITNISTTCIDHIFFLLLESSNFSCSSFMSNLDISDHMTHLSTINFFYTIKIIIQKKKIIKKNWVSVFNSYNEIVKIIK